MEEASVAGESPDRSKQRESSAEPTSQSAGSVPETRDPRLTVAREEDSPAGGTDTATKVLTVRPGTPAERETPAGPEEPSGAEESVPAGGDKELRAAVSAWIRKPGTDATAKETGATGSEDEGSSNEAAVSGGSSDGKAGGSSRPAADRDADADADADDSPSGNNGDAEGESESEGDESSDSPAGARSEGSSDTGAGDGDGTDAEAKAETKAAADDHDDDHVDGKADTDAKEEVAGEDDADGGADGDSAAAAKDEPEAEADADVKGTADAKEEADAEPDADADTDAKAGIDADAKNDTDAKADAKKDATPGTEPGGSGKPAAAAAGVDQPTTVFKAVQPKKPAVDQPTTMLKVGDTGKPKSAGPGPAESESESERTSKFVALKDDMRPGGKAPAPKDGTPPAGKAPASEATTAVPRIGPERTTQQPLPPKPPLDLLAELTNTPPPPETPVRTLVRRIKIWTPLVLLLAIIFAVVQTFRPLPAPALALTAEDTYTFDGGATRLPWPGEGQGWVDGDGIGTMGHFGDQKPVAIGSVAKTMTAYIILREHPLKPGQEGPKIKVDAKAEKEGGYDKDGESTLNTVKAGDHLTEKQALSAVMIPSANNIARLLARWDAGSEAAFVKKMNATAKELGMTGTTYTDPSGLKETTVSTAEDQVKLGRAVVKDPALVAITSAASWTDPSGHNWPNYNELPYRIGAIGIKTGSTTKAGGNLLFASRKKVGGQTVTIVGAVLGQNKAPILGTANAVSKTALLAAEEALTSAKVLKKGDVIGYVDDRLGGHTPVVVTEDVTAAGWAGLKVRLTFASGSVPHTAKAGTRVGTLTVGDGTAAAVKVPVALQKDLAEPGFGAKLTRLG
ncbi:MULTISPECIES: D-alanyl-D-alanine carboxypeptidase [Streptomyces]|uniref:D-alanyl-D-alanine carboxypeptidase n=1 Tax=Streptomyces TaxID=1883 RepID=UPI00167617DF|nr:MULTISPECIES: D-alanyl-D-alanine carboxypeptidase [Streptomyces]MBK3527136.1 D-alanyl-D-alanine carboxypeptidase [Streptomyces sp. MBT70]GGR61932.1 D-alanyl-D-alanine carboxypeptidase [Streptomyces eurythermus]